MRTENIQKTYRKHTENIWKCDKKNKRKHIKTYGNMSKRITENIRKCGQKTYRKHTENICSI